MLVDYIFNIQTIRNKSWEMWFNSICQEKSPVRFHVDMCLETFNMTKPEHHVHFSIFPYILQIPGTCFHSMLKIHPIF